MHVTFMVLYYTRTLHHLNYLIQ